MVTLVIGGAGSGKSDFAEQLIVRSDRRPRIYLATMEPLDRECLARIQRHRAMRAERAFTTVECYSDMQDLSVPAGCAVLLECMGNLCANELYRPDGPAGSVRDRILRGVDRLSGQCGELVIVSNEVFSAGADYGAETMRYLKLLAQVNLALAERADRVFEVACGIPICHKGGREG